MQFIFAPIMRLLVNTGLFFSMHLWEDIKMRHFMSLIRLKTDCGSKINKQTQKNPHKHMQIHGFILLSFAAVAVD